MEEIKSSIAEIVRDIFLEPVQPERDLSFAADCSAGILDIVEIVVALENRFGIEISDDDVPCITSTGSAADYIFRRLNENDEWLRQE
jgi:acyl carrier protein